MAQDAAWRTRSAEQRQQERRRQLIAAAFELIGDDGIAATGVRAVCRRAALTSRYFYESFSDVAELHGVVMDEVIGEVLDEIRLALQESDGDAGSRSRAAMTAALDAITGDERRARLILVEAAGHPALATRRRALMRSFAQLAREQLGALGPATDDLLTVAAAELFAAGFFGLLLAWYERQLPHSRDELIENAAELLEAFTLAVVDLSARRASR